MAKTALINKAKKTPKFEKSGATRDASGADARTVYRKFGLCRICIREMAHRGETPASPRVPGERNPGESRVLPDRSFRRSTTPKVRVQATRKPDEGRPAMTMSDPIADMLTRLRNADTAYHDAVAMPQQGQDPRRRDPQAGGSSLGGPWPTPA